MFSSFINQLGIRIVIYDIESITVEAVYPGKA